MKNRKLGWFRDYSDFRDYTPENDSLSSFQREAGQEKTIRTMLNDIGLNASRELKIPTKMDLTEWCSPIEDQGQIGSCTANSGAALLEYFERRAFGKYIDASRLFLYKTTRNLLQWKGDTGAFLRTTIGAMRLFGVLPEEYWPYKESDYDIEPPAFCYSYAQNFQALSFYRLDSNGIGSKDLLIRVKEYITKGLPSMFGFTVFESINQANSTGRIPFPGINEKTSGGHAVVAIGFDDDIKISNWDGNSTKGALKIRNSWGTQWGEDGYGWLPYDYVLYGIASDWWSLLKNEWVDTGQFK